MRIVYLVVCLCIIPSLSFLFTSGSWVKRLLIALLLFWIQIVLLVLLLIFGVGDH